MKDSSGEPPPSRTGNSSIKIRSVGIGSSTKTTGGSPNNTVIPVSSTELLFRILCADSVKRLEGRAGFAIPFAYKNPTTKVTEKLYSVHLIHQIFVGAVGGVACGIETGYIAFDRLPAPNTPFPPSWSGANAVAQTTLRNGSVIWNTTKRAVFAGLLFDLLDKNIEEARGGTRDWWNFSMAGLISGAIFGLRGGTRGLCTCSLGFGFFASLAGFFAYFGPRSASSGSDGRDK